MMYLVMLLLWFSLYLSCFEFSLLLESLSYVFHEICGNFSYYSFIFFYILFSVLSSWRLHICWSVWHCSTGYWSSIHIFLSIFFFLQINPFYCFVICVHSLFFHLQSAVKSSLWIFYFTFVLLVIDCSFYSFYRCSLTYIEVTSW